LPRKEAAPRTFLLSTQDWSQILQSLPLQSPLKPRARRSQKKKERRPPRRNGLPCHVFFRGRCSTNTYGRPPWGARSKHSFPPHARPFGLAKIRPNIQSRLFRTRFLGTHHGPAPSLEEALHDGEWTEAFKGARRAAQGGCPVIGAIASATQPKNRTNQPAASIQAGRLRRMPPCLAGGSTPCSEQAAARTRFFPCRNA